MSYTTPTLDLMEMASRMPNAIFQITAGDLCDFAHQLISSASEIARLQL